MSLHQNNGKDALFGPELKRPFRGLRFEPINEQGVVHLWGMVDGDLGFKTEGVRQGYPDCRAFKRVCGKKERWTPVRIEFEYLSRNFLVHKHDASGSDLIVCWKHNWPESPLPVLELSTAIGALSSNRVGLPPQIINDAAFGVVELFSGGGGLGVGLHAGGFSHLANVEIDPDAVQTLRMNAPGRWPAPDISDVTTFDYTPYRGVHVLAAGVPCQPFSVGGNHEGGRDRRNLFPPVFRAMRDLRPAVVIIENVRGILRRRQDYVDFREWIHAYLERPSVVIGESETFSRHLSRIRKSTGSVEYDVMPFWPIDCADYGVPQHRNRVFFMAWRSDLGVKDWKWPDKTHSEAALIYSQWGDGSYWARHCIAKTARPLKPDRICVPAVKPLELPWVTVRDVLSGLPPAGIGPYWATYNHDHVGGAKFYPGHTGASLDAPSKAIKAGVHGVPGGENMIVLDAATGVGPSACVPAIAGAKTARCPICQHDNQGGSDICAGCCRRPKYLTSREAARIQTFPDSYRFFGARGSVMSQIGNAVPSIIGELVASLILTQLRALVDRPQ